MSDNAAPEVDSSAPASVDTEPAPTSESNSDTVSREEYEKLQRENQKYREKFQPWERAFQSFDDQDRDLLTRWLPTFRTDPDQFVAIGQQIISGLTPEQQEAVGDAVAEAEQASGADLTPEKIAEIVAAELEKREQTAAERAAQNEIQSELKGLGLEPDTMEYQAVLWLALNETNGDLKKAHEAFAARQQKAIDDFVASKSNGPTLPPKGTAASPAREPIKDLADAKRKAAAFLANQPG